VLDVPDSTLLGGRVVVGQPLQEAKVPTGLKAQSTQYVCEGSYWPPGSEVSLPCVLKGLYVDLDDATAHRQLERLQPLLRSGYVTGRSEKRPRIPVALAVPIDFVIDRSLAILPYVDGRSVTDVVRERKVPSLRKLFRRIAFACFLTQGSSISHRDLDDNNMLCFETPSGPGVGLIDWDEGLWGTGYAPVSSRTYPWTERLSVIFEPYGAHVDRLALLTYFLRFITGYKDSIISLVDPWRKIRPECIRYLMYWISHKAHAVALKWIGRRVAAALQAIEADDVAYDDIPAPAEYLLALTW
jgi:hypothetical protein